MTETEQDKQFRRELDGMTETEVRDDLNFSRGITTGGETKREIVVRWLREKDREREARQRRSDWYTRWTFWIVVATFVATIIGVVATMLHP